MHLFSCMRVSWSMQCFCFLRKKKSRGKVTSHAVTIANRNASHDHNFQQQNIYVQPTPDHSSLTFQNDDATMTQFEMQKMQQ